MRTLCIQLSFVREKLSIPITDVNLLFLYKKKFILKEKYFLTLNKEMLKQNLKTLLFRYQIQS